MTNPTKQELLDKIEELQKQVEALDVLIQFKVGDYVKTDGQIAVVRSGLDVDNEYYVSTVREGLFLYRVPERLELFDFTNEEDLDTLPKGASFVADWNGFATAFIKVDSGFDASAISYRMSPAALSNKPLANFRQLTLPQTA